MMNKKELSLILEEGEGLTIEFKENVNSDLSKELVAMANSIGGRIFIGINDQNIQTGIAKNNTLLSQIQDMATHCDPPVPIEISHFENIVIIQVKEGLNKPYRCSKGFYLRCGANTQKMTTREITEFIRSEGKVRFDEIVDENVDLNKVFDSSVLTRFINAAKITKTPGDHAVLENLGVLLHRHHKQYLNNVGLLFFCRNLPPHLFFATITCALYKGLEKVTILDRKDYSADLISNIEDTILFLKKHLNLRYEIKTMRRKEILEIPEVALREAIVNAACHRDYFEKGANIMVEIFDDRIHISNPGGLPKGLSPEKFGTLSVSRNPLIASLLHRAGYIEKMGTGISRIKNALAAAGEPEPVFQFDSFFTVIFKRATQETVESAQETVESAQETVESAQETVESAQENILSVIRKNPNITRNEIAKELNATPDSVKHNLVKLTKLHRIKHIGATKKGYWQIIEKDK
jgi:ATP-dependent DNA helicase RecG